MTHKKRLKLLQTWHEKGLALEKASDEICKVFDVDNMDRCAILAAAWDLWDAYTDAVATLVGVKVWDTTGDDVPFRSDLQWWWYDNKHGGGGLKAAAAAAAWDKTRPIRTVADLCELIEADLHEKS